MRKAVILLCIILIAMGTFFGCFNPNMTFEDEYDEDGKLIIDFFGHSLDPLQGLTPDSKMILDIIEEKFQIKLRTTTTTTSSLGTLLNQLISGGDIPDMFIHFREEPAYTSWIENDYLFNYSDMLDDYPNLKRNFYALGSENIVKHFLGGDLYSFPILLHNDAPSGKLFVQMAMYYRRDWYQSLVNKGYRPESGRDLVDPEDPNFNYLNFYDLCEGFTKGDPDNNGKDDTYGYGLNKDNGVYWWYPLLNMFGMTFNGWYKDEQGDWQPEAISDTMKEAVFFIAKMFDNGLINQNYATTTTYEMMKNDFLNGKSGIIVYNAVSGMGYGIFSAMQSRIGKIAGSQTLLDVVRGMPVVTGYDGVKRIQGSVNNYAYMAINNNISDKKKKKILELMDWTLSEEGVTLLSWGVQDVHWKYDDDGNKVSLLGLDNLGYQKVLYADSVAPAAYRLKGITSWETIETNNPRPFVQEEQQVLSAWKDEHLFRDELTFICVDPEYVLIETELVDKTVIAFKNIVSKITGDADKARNQIWNQFVNYYLSRGAEYIAAKNEAAKRVLGQ